MQVLISKTQSDIQCVLYKLDSKDKGRIWNLVRKKDFLFTAHTIGYSKSRKIEKQKNKLGQWIFR